MPSRQYKIGKQKPGRIDTEITETITEPDGEHRTVILSLHPPASHTNAIATVEALGTAYEDGRDDRETELLQPPGDWLLDSVRTRLLECTHEWAQGEMIAAKPDGDTEPYDMRVTNTDPVNGELYWLVARERYGPGRTLRVRVLIEDVTPH